MCGIAGLLYSEAAGPVPGRLVNRMIDALAHRGPDDRGCFVEGGYGIGMRRLSIVDVEGGHQPMSSADGLVEVVYNGECYNHKDLREELERAGYRFGTRCDTEVLVHGYSEWGIPGLVRRMNGIFAFCVLDRRIGKAWLVRDRLGVKPLYYIDRNGRFAFASEVRSVVTSGLVRAKIDETALRGYLAYQFTPSRRTLVAGVSKVPAGHYLEWDQGRVRLERYWDLPNLPEESGGDRKERAEELRALLWDTIERQMMSDVPIGCFLSGGLDSTIVACMMAKLSPHPVRTFSIGFPGMPDCDETPYFERLSKEIGARHETIEFSEGTIFDNLSDFTWAMDEPVADPAMLPTYLLSRAASRELKVVLTGEGADEVFAGYPYYRPLVPGYRVPTTDMSTYWRNVSRALEERLGIPVPAPRNDELSPISNFPYALDPAFTSFLLHPDHRPPVVQQTSSLQRIEQDSLKNLSNASPLQSALALDTKLWLAEDLMPKLDKMTMANSIEGRVPFLDHRLVEFAFTLPGTLKVGPKHGKMILRDAVRGIIPDWMIYRPKHGFNVPLNEWFRGSLRDTAQEALLGPTLGDTGLFHRPALKALLAAHNELTVNVARPLWQLVCLSHWFARLKDHLPDCEDAGDPVTVASTYAGAAGGR
ncbi:MAG: asparagine synthase (glutamine-hydrolyzing) [Actinomycetota bacterium]